MQVQVEIEFEQLVQIVKTLTAGQLRQLKEEVEQPAKVGKPKADLKALLLGRPVATKKQLETIKNNRKRINHWRTK